jgi:hypothetical protein
MEVAEVAAQWACSFSELKKLGWRAFPADELVFEIFTARRPAWLGDWVNWLCEVMPHRWSLVRRFVRQGLCRAPETDHYVLGMIVGVCAFHDNKNTIYSALLEDTDLLDKDIWRRFEVEGGKEFCLASRDKYSRNENHCACAIGSGKEAVARPPARRQPRHAAKRFRSVSRGMVFAVPRSP